MITGIIPARGGSTGIPGKNLKNVGGKTLLSRAIETALKVTERVIVSTDAEDIAYEATRYGAEVHIRPPELATTESLMWPTIQDVGRLAEPGQLFHIQCTGPLLTVNDIRRCLDKLVECDVAVACHRSHDFLLTADGEFINTTYPLPNRQDVEQFVLSGTVWAYHTDHLKRSDVYDGRIGIVESEVPYRLDIDEPHDLLLAQKMFHAAEHQLWGDYNGHFWI